MIKIHRSTTELQALSYGGFHHPDPRVQERMEACCLRSQGVASGDIPWLPGMCKASFTRFLNAYVMEGSTQLQRLEHYRPQSQLVDQSARLEAYFLQHPPATVAVATTITELTGIVRRPAQVRQFLHIRGMTPGKVGGIPAEADVVAPEVFTKQIWSPG